MQTHFFHQTFTLNKSQHLNFKLEIVYLLRDIIFTRVCGLNQNLIPYFYTLLLIKFVLMHEIGHIFHFASANIPNSQAAHAKKIFQNDLTIDY